MLHFGTRYLKKHFFNKGNVCVVGLRGTGKDTTFSLITSTYKEYISNQDYKHSKAHYNRLELPLLNVNNTYMDFINNNIKYYEYPYIEKADIFISDCGVYFPSQYSSDLDKKYGWFSIFQALSRHLGNCNIHFNVQNLNRVWNKIREQSDIYLKCIWTVSIGRLVITHYRYYENYDSCVNNVKPFRMSAPLTNRGGQAMQFKLYKDSFTNQHGIIKEFTNISIRRGDYDTRLFKTMLKEGVKNEKKNN